MSTLIFILAHSKLLAGNRALFPSTIPNNIDPLIARKSIGAVADLLGENYLTTRFLQG